MAVAFDEYPHSRRMVRRKAKLICQQYEQRWKRKDSLSSYDSAAEFNISSSNQQNKSNELMDKREDEEADDDCYYFMEHSSSSIEAKLNEIQRNVNLINKELEIAERNFLVWKNNYFITSRVAKMARLGPKNRVRPKIFGPKMTYTGPTQKRQP
ncbi:unnamed protein product [Meloidogyne enterolobii]|uniref:Uncharacterized protein n=1 Tax=Meloidogyne enterolobii TaxID=390850 RepID=A0ACB1AJG8_MELEN